MKNLQKINSLLESLNPLLFGEDSRLRLAYVDFDQVREQDINANVMPTGMFNALVSNIKKNLALESLPLCATRVETPDVIEVVSGHHRIRAAKQAGIRGGVVLLYVGLTNSEIRAKQLAHNSISGTSDPEIVKAIFAQIEDIGDRMESFVDPNIFADLPKAVEFKMVDIDPMAEAKTVVVLFLPTQLRDFQTALDLLGAEPDHVYLANREVFDGFKEAVHRVRSELEVVSYPTAIAAMARLAIERLAQIQAEHVRNTEEAVALGREPPAKPQAPVRIDPSLLEALT